MKDSKGCLNDVLVFDFRVTFFIPKSAEGSKVGVDVDGVRVAGEAVEGGLVGARLHGSEGLLGSDSNSARTLTEGKDLL